MNEIQCKSVIVSTKKEPHLIANQFYKKGVNFVVVYDQKGNLKEIVDI